MTRRSFPSYTCRRHCSLRVSLKKPNTKSFANMEKHANANGEKRGVDAKGVDELGPPPTAPPSSAPDSKADFVQNFLCESCEQTIPLEDREEHQDWHFAKDLQAQDENGVPSNGASDPPPPTNPAKVSDPVKSDHPPEYAPPAHPPPNRRASGRPTSYRAHTNQVIEAGKIRARDEVCLSAHGE